MNLYTIAVVSIAILARFVHQGCACKGNFYFLLSSPETKELRMSRKNSFGCYQQEQFILHRANSVSDRSQGIVNNRERRRRESQKSNSATRQNNNFARASRFFVHFFAVTARSTSTTWKCVISRFVENIKKQWQNFLSLYELGYGW